MTIEKRGHWVSGHRENARLSNSGYQKQPSTKEAIGHQGIKRPYGYQELAIKSDHQEKRPSGFRASRDRTAIKQRLSRSGHQKQPLRKEAIGHQGIKRPHGHQAAVIKSDHQKRPSRKKAIRYQGIDRPHGHQVAAIKKRGHRALGH